MAPPIVILAQGMHGGRRFKPVLSVHGSPLMLSGLGESSAAELRLVGRWDVFGYNRQEAHSEKRLSCPDPRGTKI